MDQQQSCRRSSNEGIAGQPAKRISTYNSHSQELWVSNSDTSLNRVAIIQPLIKAICDSNNSLKWQTSKILG